MIENNINKSSNDVKEYRWSTLISCRIIDMLFCCLLLVEMRILRSVCVNFFWVLEFIKKKKKKLGAGNGL